jgi:hypothetical protein
MNDKQLPRFGPELSRTIIAIIIWAGVSFFCLNAVSGHRILGCDRYSGIASCRLINKQLTNEQQVIELGEAKIRKAVREKYRGHRSISATYATVLITTQGNFWITPADNINTEDKQRIADNINFFLVNPHISTLKVDSGYSSVFWIGVIIVSTLFMLLVFALTVALRFPSNNTEATESELLKTLWDKNSN